MLDNRSWKLSFKTEKNVWDMIHSQDKES
jgi:hypothetical protein